MIDELHQLKDLIKEYTEYELIYKLTITEKSIKFFYIIEGDNGIEKDSFHNSENYSENILGLCQDITDIKMFYKSKANHL